MKTENQIVIYTSPKTGTQVEIKFDKEQIWLDTHKISEIFDVDRTVIVRHIGNIYKSGELSEQKLHRLQLMGKIER